MKSPTHFILPFLWTSLVLVLSLLPSNDLPSYSWLSFPYSDKLWHFLFYLIMSELWFLALSGNNTGYPSMVRIKIAISLVGFGGFIEILQAFSATRSAEGIDFLADCLGVLLALILYERIVKAKNLLVKRIKYLSFVFPS